VVEEVDEADPAVDGGADHTPQVSPLKVGPHNLVQLPVTKHLKSYSVQHRASKRQEV